MKLSVAPLLTRSAILGALPIVVALMLSGVISFSYNRLLKDYRDAVDHTFLVMAAIDGVLLGLQDAETGQRGFIITGDDSYLAPFDASRIAIPKVLASLHHLVSDNIKQHPQIANLQKLADTKLSELQDTITIRKTDGLEPARLKVLSNSGKTTMDQIRAVAADMRQTETTLFESRVAVARRAERSMIFVAIICVALSLLGRMVAVMMKARLKPDTPNPAEGEITSARRPPPAA